MKVFPSKLPFASFYCYSPHGHSEKSKFTARIVKSLKKDGFQNLKGEYVQVIDKMAGTISGEIPKIDFLQNYFSKTTLLVPIPGRNPRKDPSAVWPALKFCELLFDNQLVVGVYEALERVTPVTKSATAPKGKRPMPEEHYNSLKVKESSPLRNFDSITLVDDVITRGSTMIAMYQKLSEAYKVQVNCFTIVRTVSEEIEVMIDPVEGTISFDGINFSREP